MELLDSVIGLITSCAKFGGGLWLVWGVVVLAGGLKDKNGPALQSGIWQVVGGGLILAAAMIFDQVEKIEIPTAELTPETRVIEEALA